MTKEEFMSMASPYKLMCVGVSEQHQYTVLSVHFGQMNLVRVKPDNGVDFPLPISGVKPILHPLSDITKQIEHNGDVFVPYIELLRMSSFDVDNMRNEELEDYKNAYSATNVDIELISFSDVLKLIEWKFDVAGLIEKGEAIDVNTLPENPYK